MQPALEASPKSANGNMRSLAARRPSLPRRLWRSSVRKSRQRHHRRVRAHKIRSIVKDPATAERRAGQRVRLQAPVRRYRYFETYNLPHVNLVDVSNTPTSVLRPMALEVDGTEYPLDTIVCATALRR